jgi:exosortase/archaeosortase family protein
MIIFVAFLVAFGPMRKALLWFIPVGLLIIHGINLARIALLFWVSLYMPDFMYFTHKYLFTAILYVVVFLLWIGWVKRFALKPYKS